MKPSSIDLQWGPEHQALSLFTATRLAGLAKCDIWLSCLDNYPISSGEAGAIKCSERLRLTAVTRFVYLLQYNYSRGFNLIYVTSFQKLFAFNIDLIHS